MLENTIQHMPCPVCRAQIPFTVQGLLSGERFICPNCSAVVSLPVESKQVVETAMNELEHLRSKKDNLSK